MGWSSDWLYQLLLDRARAALSEAIGAANKRAVTGPELLIAAEYAKYTPSNFTMGDPVKIWSSEDDFSSLKNREWYAAIPKRDRTDYEPGSIFLFPQLSWCLSPDRKQVLICKSIGPLYGVGGWWDVIGQGDKGALRQSNNRGGWVS